MFNTRIIIILVIFTSFLCSMIAMKQRILITGTPVLLETEPIDPRSLFRGDYVRLNYVISSLKPSSLKGNKEFKRHDKVYVELQQHGKYWHPIAIHHDLPKNENVVLAGKVQYVNEHTWNAELQESEEITTLHIKYGIENYFVPEGEGLDLERRDNDQIVDIHLGRLQHGYQLFDHYRDALNQVLRLPGQNNFQSHI